MPELPEVETTCRGIRPHLVGQQIEAIYVYQPRLRWPVPETLQTLVGHIIQAVQRRGKYLFLRSACGTAILHLGMSGSLRISDRDTPRRKHDHIEFYLAAEKCLRFHDPRRFGAVLWTRDAPEKHPLIAKLGLEPLSDDFEGEYLFQQAKQRRSSIKTVIMNAHIVVGVGNIYASESLFLAGIHPQRAAERISYVRYEKLVAAIKQVLTQAIAAGGTSLRDFVREDGKPGYFKQQLQVYGRADQPCLRCETPIRQITLAQRASYYCPVCQR